MGKYIKEGIRLQFSRELDILIPRNGWARILSEIDINGRPTRKEMASLIAALAIQQEKFEELIEDLYFRLETLEGKTPEKVEEEEIALPRVSDITAKLDEQIAGGKAAFKEGAQALYLYKADWKKYASSLDPQRAKEDPSQGYGKEVDPIDGNEKTCFYYKGLPVFRRKGE